MKTNTIPNQIKAPSRPEQLSTSSRAPINFQKRRVNRALNTDNLLALLQTESPQFVQLAKVVGRWVWIRFADKQPPEVTRILAELGFHWNNHRQTWQHPCGTRFDRQTRFDPRKRNGSYSRSA